MARMLKMCAAYNRQYGAQYLAVMPTNLFSDRPWGLSNNPKTAVFARISG